MNKIQAIVFFGIILIGAITSYFILFNKDASPDPATTTPAAASSQPAANKAQSDKDQNQQAATKSKADKTMAALKNAAQKPLVKKTPPKAPAPAKPAGGFTSEKALMDALAKAVQDKNTELFFELSGQNTLSASAKARLTALLKREDLKIDPQQALSAIGRSQNSTRWALRLLTSSGEVIEILTDLDKDAKGTWKVLKIRPPLAMKKSMAAASSSNPANSTGTPIKTGALTGSDMEDSELPDAMMVAYAFSKAVINRDIKTARALTDPERLNNEKLAALLIALEEGEFRLKTDKPLVITLSRDDLTWAITRVESSKEKSEFGLEMSTDQKGRWTIAGLTFSKLISLTAMAAGGGDIAYTPIHKNPQGGDSLVLYFEFDNEQVSARTRKQLAIVAAILGEDKKRKLHINGHADAKGEDNYNVALSKRRTSAVRNALIELGVAADQIVTQAFGETMPLKPNFKSDGSDNPTGRAQNRRTEIYLDF